MRADRLLSVLMLLRHRGKLTAAEIASELEVSERTILRDIESLSTSGVPIYTDRGRGGGVSLLPGYRTDLTGLTLEEAKALMAANSGRSASPAFARAMRKVAAALPEPHRDAASRAAQRILVRGDGFARPLEPEAFLGELQHAVIDGFRIRVTYRAAKGPAAERVLDPVGLVHAGRAWYLLALRDGVDRTYRVSRFEAVELLPDPAERPLDVDLEVEFQRSRASFRGSLPMVSVDLRVRASAWEALADTAVAVVAGPEPESGDPADAGPWVRATLRFADNRHARLAVWTVAPEAEILAPDSLRTAMRERAAALAAVHADPPNS